MVETIKASKKTDKLIVTTAPCIITAAAGEGDEKKLPTITMEAYNGGIMAVGWYGDVVIDLAGLETPANLPILFNHDDWSIDSVLGQTSDIDNDGKRLSVTGTIMADTDLTRKTLTLAKNGYIFQSSIGALPLKRTYIQEDQEVKVNGRTLKGPFDLIEKSVLREVSTVLLGADSTTTAKIAAKRKTKRKGISMTMPARLKKWLRAKYGAGTLEKITAKIKAADDVDLTGEEEDVADTAVELAEIVEEAQKDGWTEEDIQEIVELAEEIREKAEDIEAKEGEDGEDDLEAEEDDDEEKKVSASNIRRMAARIKKIEAKMKRETIRARRPEAANINVGTRPQMTVGVITAAAARSTGMRTLEAQFTADELNHSQDVQVRSISELIHACLAAEGKRIDATRHDTDRLLKAGFSTSSLANVLSNLANKYILEGYGAVEEAWKEVAAIRPVNDFKVHTGVRMVMSDLLENLNKDGTIKHGSITDDKREIKADTKALRISIDRQDLINDDLGILQQIPTALGFSAARTFNADFWGVLNKSSAQFNDSTKRNLATGALTIDNLDGATKLFAELKDSDGNPIGILPSVLLTGTTYAASAMRIYASHNIVGGSDVMPDANIYANRFKPVSSAYLTAGHWYLLAVAPMFAIMDAAFLHGNQTPFVETAEADFERLGIQMRTWYDYGISFGDWRAGVKSAGA